MNGSERTLAVTREWMRKAENDLTNAAHTLKLVSRAIDFPKTHDVEKLISLLPAAARVGLGAEEQARLTEYATGARYPGWAEIPLAEARRAVAIARRVRREIRRRLPREVLRRKAR